MKKQNSSTLALKLQLSVAILCIYGTMFLVVQQYIRLSANETPLQYALEVRNKLELGITPAQALAGHEKQELDKTLDVFLMVYDNKGRLIESTATLHGSKPVLPAGALMAATQTGENKITWQPAHGIRNATVVLPFHANGSDGFVVAGKSLQEAEKRIHFAVVQITTGIICTLIATFGISWIFGFFRRLFSSNNSV